MELPLFPALRCSFHLSFFRLFPVLFVSPQFQLWDTIQAMCSYLRGMLCTHAVLTGLGVGDVAASATSATLNWVLRDGVGMFGGLLFAWWGAERFGASLRSW